MQITLNLGRRSFLAGSAVAIACVVGTALISAQRTPTAPPRWVTVKTFSLLNQTSVLVPPYTIYTPVESGLFRVSYYVEPVSTTLTAPNSSDTICPNVSYVDDSGTSQTRLLNAINDYVPSTCAGVAILPSGPPAIFQSAGDEFVFRAKASIPITLNFSVGTISSTYNVVGIIEHLTGSVPNGG